MALRQLERDYLVVVCDKCLTASCWHGEFMCQESQGAGTKKMLASDLDALNLEHRSHYSQEKLLEVCGCVEQA